MYSGLFKEPSTYIYAVLLELLLERGDIFRCFKAGYYGGVAGNIVVMLLLVPAVVVFRSLYGLRKTN